MSSIRSAMCRLAGTTGRSMTASLSPWESSATATRRDPGTPDPAGNSMNIPPGPPGPSRLPSAASVNAPLPTVYGSLHIVLNMWALYVLAPPLEQMLGRLRFIAIYLVSALGGSVLYYLLVPPNSPPAIGASGAIFGLFGAWFILSRRLRLDARMVVILIMVNLVLSFTLAGIASPGP